MRTILSYASVVVICFVFPGCNDSAQEASKTRILTERGKWLVLEEVDNSKCDSGIGFSAKYPVTIEENGDDSRVVTPQGVFAAKAPGAESGAKEIRWSGQYLDAQKTHAVTINKLIWKTAGDQLHGVAFWEMWPLDAQGDFAAAAKCSGISLYSGSRVGSSVKTLGETAGAAPHQPKDLSAAALHDKAVILDWQMAAGADSYAIERSEDNGQSYKAIAQVGGIFTLFIDHSVLPGKTYMYRVSAANALGVSIYSNVASAQVNVPPAPPAAPSQLVVSRDSARLAKLSWLDNASGEFAYRIERKKPGDAAFRLVAIIGLDVHDFLDNDVDEQSDYVYRVYASNVRGSSAYSNEDGLVKALSAKEKPLSPEDVKVSYDMDVESVVLSWVDAADNEIGYTIKRLPADAAPDAQPYTVNLPADAEVYVDRVNLLGSTTYNYEVSVFNGLGEASVVQSVNTPARSNLSVALTGTGSVTGPNINCARRVYSYPVPLPGPIKCITFPCPILKTDPGTGGQTLEVTTDSSFKILPVAPYLQSCSADFSVGRTIKLNVFANGGFNGWQGCDQVDADNVCYVQVDANNRIVTADMVELAVPVVKDGGSVLFYSKTAVAP